MNLIFITYILSHETLTIFVFIRYYIYREKYNFDQTL